MSVRETSTFVQVAQSLASNVELLCLFTNSFPWQLSATKSSTQHGKYLYLSLNDDVLFGSGRVARLGSRGRPLDFMTNRAKVSTDANWIEVISKRILEHSSWCNSIRLRASSGKFLERRRHLINKTSSESSSPAAQVALEV